VDEISANFGNVYSPIKVKLPGKNAKIVDTGAGFYFSPQKYFEARCTLKPHQPTFIPCPHALGPIISGG